MKFNIKRLGIISLVTFSLLFMSRVTHSRDQTSYTPIPIGDDKSNIISLEGRWDFWANPGNNFNKGLPDVKSRDTLICIPSQLDAAYNGFYEDEVDSTAFHRVVTLPEYWEGQRVILRFNSVEGEALVYFNGEFCGRHAGAFTPFEFDVTDFARFGQDNHVTVFVRRSLVTKATFREYLGMVYEPEIFAVSPIHLSKFDYTTSFDEAYENARLNIDFEVKNIDQKSSGPIALDFLLTAPDGSVIELGETEVKKIHHDSNGVVRQLVQYVVKSPLKWDCEHPNLYQLSCNLKVDGQISESYQTRVGFRDLKIKGNKFFSNNHRLKVRGINYHTRVEGAEHALNREQLLKDLILFRDANINLIRPFPVPPFLPELFDSLGIMVTIDTPVTFVGISWKPELKGVGSDPQFIEDYLAITREKIASKMNHPSIIMWSIGNESIYTLPAFMKGGYLTQELDSTRLVVAEAHESIPMGMCLPQTTVDCVHYPNLLGFGAPGRRPMYHGEWCHTHAYSKAEYRTDPGVRDAWVDALEQHTEYMWRLQGVLGGNIFSGNDFIWKGKRGQEPREWGIFDKWRRPKPEYWHVRKSNAPVRVQKAEVKNDTLNLVLVNRFLFTDLAETKMVLNHNGMSSEASIDLAPNKKDTLKVPYSEGDKLSLQFYSPDGRLVNSFFYGKQFDVKQPPERSADLKFRKTSSSILVTGDDYNWEIDASTGLILSGKKGEKTIMTGGPFLTATPNHTKGVVFAHNWKMKDLELNESERTLIVKGAYNEAEGHYKYFFKADGNVEVSYLFDWTRKNVPMPKGHHKRPDSQDMREMGITFQISKSNSLLNWVKDSYWTDYPDDHIGRMKGEISAFTVGYFGVEYADKNQNWADDQNENGRRDFRSTKTNIHFVSLSADDESGVEVFSDGTQNSRTYYSPEEDSFYLLISDFYSGGHEIFTHGNGIERPVRIMDTGKVLKDEVSVFLK